MRRSGTHARRARALDILLVLAVFALSLGLYLRTLAPSVATVFDDSPEFQLVCYLLGVAHPTGYPLYTLLGKLFTLLPVGDVAYRVNLMSALFAAMALAWLALLLRELTGRRLAGALGAAALAVAPAFWAQATIAEVYPLHLFLLTLCLWLVARWERSGEAGQRWLIALAAAFGLALAHHRTVMLFAPGILLVILWVWRRWLAGGETSEALPSSWPRLWSIALALLLPLALYLYIPFVGARVGSLDGTYRNTLNGFLRHVLALDYGVFLTGNPFGQSRDIRFYISLFAEQFGIAGALLGLAGLMLPWRRRRVWLAILVSLLLCLGFAVAYRVADIEVFLLPAFLIWTLGIGVALSKIQNAINALLQRYGVKFSSILSALLVCAFLVQPLLIASRAWPAMDRSRHWEVHDVGVDALAQPLPPNATIIGILGEMTILRYFQWTQGLRPDVRTVAADRESERWAVLEQVLAQSGEAYLTRQLPGVEARYSLDALGPLIRVTPKPAPTDVACAGAEWLPGMCLQRYEAEMKMAHGVTTVRVTLEWLASAKTDADIRLSVRLHTLDERMVAQHDSRPVHETYPTTFWQPGETVTDVHDLVVPPDAAPAEYEVVLVLYDPTDGHELTRGTLGRLSLTGAPRLSSTITREFPFS